MVRELGEVVVCMWLSLGRNKFAGQFGCEVCDQDRHRTFD